MKYFSTIILALLAFCSILSAQENTSKLIDDDKEKFEENVFNEEFGLNEFEELDSVEQQRKLYDKIPEKLPDWVFTPFAKTGKIQVVGFSDPNMEEGMAISQAVLRAKAMFALYNLSKVSNITDDYTNLKESGKYSLYATKFQDFSMSKAKLAYNNSSISVIDTFYTKYNEGIVLLEFEYQAEDSINLDTINVKGEHLQIYIERNFQKERVEFFNFVIEDKLEKDSIGMKSDYNYKIINRGYDITSVFADSIINFEERTYNYRAGLEFERDTTAIESKEYRLNRGLWNASISGVLSNITVLSKQLSSQVKNSNDFYTIKTEGLIRTVAQNRVSFGFNDFKMYDNNFYIDLNGRIIY